MLNTSLICLQHPSPCSYTSERRPQSHWMARLNYWGTDASLWLSLKLLNENQSVQLLSHVGLFAIPWTGARQASLSIINSRSLLKLMSITLVMPSKHLILCHPLLLPPSIFPSIRVLSTESVLHIRWPKYWSFSFNISPSNEYSGLIFLRIDWFEFLAVQGTLTSFLQHHSSKAFCHINEQEMLPPSVISGPQMWMLLLLLSRFSRVQLCATP